MPNLAHTFTSADSDVTFSAVALAPGFYAIEVTGPGVLIVCPGGGAYTMNVDGPRGLKLTTAQLESAVLDRWSIVLKQTAEYLSARS